MPLATASIENDGNAYDIVWKSRCAPRAVLHATTRIRRSTRRRRSFISCVCSSQYLPTTQLLALRFAQTAPGAQDRKVRDQDARKGSQALKISSTDARLNNRTIGTIFHAMIMMLKGLSNARGEAERGKRWTIGLRQRPWQPARSHRHQQRRRWTPEGDIDKSMIEKCSNSGAETVHCGNSSSIEGLAHCNERRRAPRQAHDGGSCNCAPVR